MFATKASSRRLPGQVVSTLTSAVEGRTEAVTTFASTPKGRSPVRVRQVQKCVYYVLLILIENVSRIGD